MESIQFDDDETQFTPRPAAGDGPSPAEDSLGNRPAAGARQGTPDQVFGGAAQSAGGGDDFLGLSEEMGVLDDELAAAATADEPQLFDLDQAEGQAQLDMAPEASADDIDLDLLAPDPELDAETHHLFDHQDEVEAGVLGEEHEPRAACEDGYEDEEWEQESGQLESGGLGKRLALVALAFVLGGGLYAAKHFLLERSSGAPTELEVAQGPLMRPTPPAQPRANASVSPAAAAEPAQPAPLGTAEPGRESLALVIANTLGMPLMEAAMNMARGVQQPPPLDQVEPPIGEDSGRIAGPPGPQSSAQELEDDSAETPAMAAEDAPLDAQAQLDAEPTETSPELIAQAPDELAQQLDSDVASPQQVAVLDTVNQRSTTTETGTSFVLPGSADEEESAQQPSHDLPLDPRIATTWLSEEVPEQHYEHDAQVQTPVVGEVRVILASGDVFEGRLVSVGEGRIWLASDLGRFALDSSAVDSVQRLVEASGGELGSMDDLLPGERVTVKLPGGSISGRIVATQGTRITLVTDSGARLTLDDPEIEIASRGSAIRLGGSGQDD